MSCFTVLLSLSPSAFHNKDLWGVDTERCILFAFGIGVEMRHRNAVLLILFFFNS